MLPGPGRDEISRLGLQPHSPSRCSRLALVTSIFALLLAHQGGWDEIGMVAAPLLIVGALLVIANRRAKRLLAGQAAEAARTDEDHADEDRQA